MSDLQLEVWEPNPIIPTPGTYVSRFNRYYLSINPNAAEGPPTWRISDPDEFPCDGGSVIPPGLKFMVAAEAPMKVEGDNTGVKYSFDIGQLVDINTPSSADPVTSVADLDLPVLLSNTKDNPTFSIYDNNDKATVTVFNIYGLAYEEWNKNGRRMKATVYNSDRSGFITTSDPVQSAPNADTTDLFFDIDSLPHET